MGYSYNALAGFALDKIADNIGCGKDGLPSNTFVVDGVQFFYELGREQADGAITGVVWKFLPDGVHVRKAGSIRIEPDGVITRFPKSKKNMRTLSTIQAVAKFREVYKYLPDCVMEMETA